MPIKSILQPLIDIARINKPTGIWLLFLPCLFGIFLSYKLGAQVNLIYFITLFFLGSVLMRSAGCIINDIFDQKFDQKVARTKKRPIADNKLNLYIYLAFLALLLGASLAILLQFNKLTIGLGILAVVLVVLYPLMKRITYYPQLFLGLTFNFGILMVASAINGLVSLPFIMLYISCIIWTLIYDTIYAYQDIEDDIKIGVKSSAIRFGPNPQKILYFLAFIQILILGAMGYLLKLKMAYYFMIYMGLFHLLCQIKTCNFKDAQDCLDKFKTSPFTGLIILMAIIIG